MKSKHFSSLARTAQSLVEAEAHLNRDVSRLMMGLYGDDPRLSYLAGKRGGRLTLEDEGGQGEGDRGMIVDDENTRRLQSQHQSMSGKSLAEESEIAKEELLQSQNVINELFIGLPIELANPEQREEIGMAMGEIAQCREIIQVRVSYLAISPLLALF